MSLIYEPVPSVTPFLLSQKFQSFIVGPVGCVAGDTLVATEFGPMPISHIDRPTRVLSWNAETGRYQLSLSGGSFPKGRDCLYRVVLRSGEFDAAGSHLLLCADGEYRRVSELQVGDVLAACSHDPVQYGSGAYPAEFPVDEPSFSRTGEDCLGHYAASARQYGQPFLRAGDNDLASAPSRAGARKPSLFSYVHTRVQQGVLSVLSPLRSHYGLCAALPGTTGSSLRIGHPQPGAVGRAASISSVRAARLSLASWLSQWNSAFRQTVRGLVLRASSLLHPSQSPSYGVSNRAIVSLTRKQVQEPYWDMQVNGTQNYVTVDGCIHHNSTKTTASLIKLLMEAKRIAPCLDGVRRSRAVIVRNTRQQLLDSTIPDWLKLFPEGEAGSYQRTELKFTLRVDDVECEVLFRGLDDSQDVRRLLSLQLSFAMLDEVREINPDVFNALTGRLGRYPNGMMVPHRPEWGLDDKGNPIQGCVDDLGRPMKKLWGATNPADQDSFWETYLSNPPENAHVTIQPSGRSPEADWLKHLPSSYYEDMMQGKTEDWISVYVDGQWGKSLSGQPVFKSFNRATHVAKTPLNVIVSVNNPILIGVDAGLTPAAVLGQLIHDGRLLVHNALVSDGMGALRFIREKLKPLLANKFPGHPVAIIIDPAAFQRAQTDERTVADIYKAEGFSVRPAKTNALAARLAAVDNFLTRTVDGKAGVLFDKDGTEPLVQALSGKYRYKINVKGERDESPEKSHPWSDVVDGFQYLCLHAGGGALFGAPVSGGRREIKPAPVRWAA